MFGALASAKVLAALITAGSLEMVLDALLVGVTKVPAALVKAELLPALARAKRLPAQAGVRRLPDEVEVVHSVVKSQSLRD